MVPKKPQLVLLPNGRYFLRSIWNIVMEQKVKEPVIKTQYGISKSLLADKFEDVLDCI